MASEGKVARGHVAVVYFHGMGNQRRFEETARLVDRLDTYLRRDEAGGGSRGILRGISARAEVPARDGKPDVNYIVARYVPEPKNNQVPSDRFHFYEAYWADEMAQKRPVVDVLRWVLQQIRRPITTVFTPWRERQRLRRSSLVEMLQTEVDAVKKRHPVPEDVSEETRDRIAEAREAELEKVEAPYKTMLNAYATFDGRDTEGGWFRDFEDHLRTYYKDDDPDALVALARRWWWAYMRRECANLFFMLGILLALLLVTFVLAKLALAGLRAIPYFMDLGGIGGLSEELPDWAKPTWTNAFTLGFGILLLLGLKGFLVDRLADVEAWSTYSETDEKFAKRRAVLEKSVDLLSHAVSQPGCKRVVIVAHSLGTSVAYDAILAAVHANRAVNPSEPSEGRLDFSKITHFITMGSPIDKIAYFFESFRSPERRYRKIYNEFRGDIGTAPFTRSGGQLAVHWINFWDRLDIISGSLESPAPQEIRDNRRDKPIVLVDNVHVNNLRYLNPGAAHNAYFDNKRVISALSDILFDGRGTYDKDHLNWLRKEGKIAGLDYRGADFGPGQGQEAWIWSLRAMIAVPFLVTFALIAQWTGHQGWAFGLGGAAVLLAAWPTATILWCLVKWLCGRFKKPTRLTDPF